MPIEESPGCSNDAPTAAAAVFVPDDAFLMASVVGGDEAALRKLMDRYDRLVRYVVFRAARQRCALDPMFVESVASASWAGFVQSLSKNPDRLPESAKAYLALIARNQTVSALRQDKGKPVVVSLDAAEGLDPPDQLDDPTEQLSNLEELELLRVCLAECDQGDRLLIGQLHAITERRWLEAANELDLKESTLRSRWARLLARLRARLAQKTPKSFAPASTKGD